MKRVFELRPGSARLLPPIVAAAFLGLTGVGCGHWASGLVSAPHAMVVSASPPATRVGLEVLESGGNAIDAAVAVGFALAVVHPSAGNLGGGGFLISHQAETGSLISLDFREAAPAGAFREMYLDSSGELREGLSIRGHLASAVPGSVAGLHLAWELQGSKSWSSLVEPAIRLARQGFTVSRGMSRSLTNARQRLEVHPESRRIFLKGGELYEPGDVLVQAELAWTLQLIADQGPDAFYRGAIADRIVAEMEQGGGIITHEDLAGYEARVREPVSGTYRGLEVVSMGSPSSGGIVLLEMLNMAERFSPAALGFGSGEEILLKAEIGRRAFADRSKWLGDADFVDVPLEELTSKDHAAELARSIRLDEPSSSADFGMGSAVQESESTTHYSIIDCWGNAVAVTTTINGSYGSGVTVTGAGFLLNNEMDDFTSRPGTPNLYGLVQGDANGIAAGKRPLSSMTPTIVRSQGEPILVLGSPGGPTITSTVFQIILNVVDHRMGLDEAVGAPRVHHQWLPDELHVEEGALSISVERRLKSLGLKLAPRGTMGDAQCILIDPVDGTRLGMADPRNDGLALGY